MDRPPVTGSLVPDAGGLDASRPDTAQGPASHVFSGPVLSTSAGLYEIEPDLAVSSTGVVASAFMASGPGTIAYAFSRDDGASWSAPQALLAPPNSQAVDPSLAADGAGGFLLTYLTEGAAGRHVYAAMAPEGTMTFGEPVEVSDPAAPATYDKPWALVLADGTRVIVYTTDSGNTVYVARSTSTGIWTRSSIAPDGTLRGVAFPCASGTRLFVAYLVPGGIALSASDDGGATWPAASTTVVQAATERAAFEMPTCVANGSDVWISYGLTKDVNSEQRADELTAIRIAHSKDSGRSIDARYSTGEGGHFMHPRLVRDAVGTLHLVYYEGARAGDAAGSFRHARSIDDGVTWTATEAIGPAITFETSRTGFDWLGDYVGAATRGEHVYTAYVQNQTDGGQVSHVAFGRVDPP